MTVYNGKLIKNQLDLYIYQFNFESFLAVLEDTPAKIEIQGIDYDCEIISVNGQQVQIALKETLGNSIPTAKIKINTWYLLEILKKKYEESLSDNKKFKNGYKLFSGNFAKIDGGNFHPSYSTSEKNTIPNESQHRAILSSINDFLSIIWGPPGTGKTLTIAKAIESHLNLGRKVLLLSHANNAVDQALEKVAVQTKDSYYKNCKLVRLGIPKTQRLEKIASNYPLVLIDKIVEYKSKELIQRKSQLISNLEKLKLRIKDYESVIGLWNEIQKYDKIIEEHTNTFNKDKTTYQNLQRIGFELKARIQNEYLKLNKAKQAGTLKQILFGLNPQKILNTIQEYQSKLKTLDQQINGLKNSLDNIKRSIDQNLEIRKKTFSNLKSKLSGEKNNKEVLNKIKDLNESLKSIALQIDEIDKQIDRLKINVISEANLVATTLVKSYTSKEIENIEFDVIVVDEVSMAPLPMLFWTASKAKKGITIVGDFNQLPPICVTKEEIGKKWLKRSIFNVLNLDSVAKANSDKIKLLNIQYRMNPLISEIPRKKIYNEQLRDYEETKSKVIYDNISESAPICLIDTSPHNPWCSQLEKGRFNLINALICVSLAEKLVKKYQQDNEVSIGIITPYRNQARLIFKIAEDKNLLNSNNLRINDFVYFLSFLKG